MGEAHRLGIGELTDHGAQWNGTTDYDRTNYFETVTASDDNLRWAPAPRRRSKTDPLLETPFNELDGAFSSDGRWMAYQSDESGQDQIYVQTIPASGAKYQISTTGGTQPRWRRDGKELFYFSTDRKLMAVPMALGARVEPGTPQALFTAVGLTGYAPTRDGQRFLVNVPAGAEGAAAPPITVVLNWAAALPH